MLSVSANWVLKSCPLYGVCPKSNMNVSVSCYCMGEQVAWLIYIIHYRYQIIITSARFQCAMGMSLADLLRAKPSRTGKICGFLEAEVDTRVFLVR